MGDRISIAFKNGDEESITLFNHWGGLEFKKIVTLYIKDIKQYQASMSKNVSDPLSRLEPNTIMVDFIRWFSYKYEKRKHLESSLYLGVDEFDGDNSDNGHWVFNLQTNKWTTSNHDKEKKDLDRATLILHNYNLPNDIIKQITAWRVMNKI